MCFTGNRSAVVLYLHSYSYWYQVKIVTMLVWRSVSRQSIFGKQVVNVLEASLNINFNILFLFHFKVIPLIKCSLKNSKTMIELMLARPIRREKRRRGKLVVLLPLHVGSRIPGRHFEYHSDVTQLGAGDSAPAHRLCLTFESRSLPNEAMPPNQQNAFSPCILSHMC